jgi:ribose transport system substrate-binding protein
MRRPKGVNAGARMIGVLVVTIFLVAAVMAATSAGSVRRSSAPGFLARAKAFVNKLENPPTKWNGPTTGPKIAKNKTIILITPLAVASGPTFATYLKNVGKLVGWNVKVIDQTFDLSKWNLILDQAIALHPNGIIATLSPDTIQPELETMQKNGITYEDYDNYTHGGPDPKYTNMFVGINSPAYEMGEAKAAWGIVHSKGKARWINAGGNAPGISGAKVQGALNYWKTCTTCTELLNFATSDPTALNTPTGGGALMSGWVSKYGSKPFYLSVQTDVMIPNLLPALFQAKIPSSEVTVMGDGGYPDAYARIRQGNQYQQMTMAEPLQLYAYWSVDEFNRSFHHQKASGYIAQPLLIDKTNVNRFGGVHDVYNPPFAYKPAYCKIWGVKC